MANDKFGGLQIAVNATGRNLVRPLLETTKAELQEMAEIQFVAPFQFLQAMVRGMSGPGSIVHVSSVTSRKLLPNHAAYMGAKAGMEQVVRAFAWEFGYRQIRVNAVAPSLTRTPMTEAAFADPERIARFAESFFLKRISTTQEVAAAVAWLCDPECFMTGEILQANGGALLGAPPASPA